ncbi:hypothetical protein C882_2588 [Caenispirillum salinarum AK4]|uniref:HicB-like antitoxin of toxin-antitoxin system domain-containing protein n=1 Tax=Caenispirillum salinarum AK4 TaxID=1238182 RepID=K9H5Y1_9PROT|nr:hypothetical protein [Caenispirillum salinarum]EKV32509.1 hypothetical protein C882_2588 [Caenispirillum salinarum AK4]
MTRDVAYPASVSREPAAPGTPVTVRLPQFPELEAVGPTEGEALSEAQVRLQGMINDMAARGEQIPMPTQASGPGQVSVTVHVPEPPE